MAASSSFREYWQWWIVIFWLAGYEIYALVTHQATLSRLVWRAYRDSPWLPWVVAPIAGVLLVHFFARRGTPFPAVLLLLGVGLIVLWGIRRFGGA